MFIGNIAFANEPRQHVDEGKERLALSERVALPKQRFDTVSHIDEFVDQPRFSNTWWRGHNNDLPVSRLRSFPAC